MILAENHAIAPLGKQSNGLKRAMGFNSHWTPAPLQTETECGLTANLCALMPIKISLISDLHMSTPDAKGDTRVARQRTLDTGAA